MRKKMVIIGAGSALFTKDLILDLIEDSRNGNEWSLGLVDISEEALLSIEKLARKMIKEKNTEIEVSVSTNRCDLLKGADYVVATIGVGGRRAWEQDVFIPRKYGIFQPIGDTTMPGGISRAMRMIPAMIDIANDVERLCPNAYFFNYSNPMAVICRAVRKATSVPVIGLCHGVFLQELEIADYLGLERDNVSCLYAGVNHLTFIYDYRYKGKDAFPIFREKLDKIKMQGYNFHDTKHPLPAISDGKSILPYGIGPFSCSLFEDYGAYPCPGDVHVLEFYPERFADGNYYGKTIGVDTNPRFEDIIEFGDQLHNRMVALADSDGSLPDDLYNHIIREKLLAIINSMEKDDRKIYPVNLPNNGAVPNLPKDAILEIPAAATGKGLCALQQNDFPDILAGIIAKQVAIFEIIVEAAIKGDKNLFAEAVMMGGYISDRNAVKKMVDELIAANAHHLNFTR